MKKIVYIVLLLNFTAFSQSPAGIWYFGNKAGINFNTGTNPVSINDGQLNTFEGCATLCDESGNLLFYSDGIKVWNRNHSIMPNGNGLLGDPSSTQSAVIVPRPNNPNIYYIFTVDELGKTNGLNYSIIDLTADGGLGDVITKNVQLITPSLEKIAVVRHGNGINFWVISHRYNSNQFVSYEITPTGISAPITSSVGVTITGDSQRTLGYLKSSPNGQYVASANSGVGSNVQLFSFNDLNGQLSLISTSSSNSDNIGAYGLEFSSNSQLLYVSRIDFPTFTSQIFQYNIVSQNEAIINASKTLINQYIFDDLNDGIFCALQLAPNQKIYIARNNSQYLAAINSPNTVGVGCQFISNAVNLAPNFAYFGLPTFIASYLDLNFIANDFCLGNETSFQIPEITNIQTISWNFGDPMSTNNTSSIEYPTHLFTTIGTYTVTLTVQTASNSKTFSKQIHIVDAPIANQPTTYELCDDNSDTIANFTLTNKSSEVLGTQSSSNYAVSYHLNQYDAEHNENQIPNNYQNTSTPQTIYARIQATNGTDCFAVTPFELKVNPKPVLESDSTQIYCTNNYPNTITLAAGNTNPSENLTYLWSTNETSETIQVNQAGVYTVEATNSFGCTSTRTIIVIESNSASINYTLEGTLNNYSLIVNTSGVGNYVYAIDNEYGSYQNSNIFTNIIAGDHIIYVKDLNGCGITSADFSILGYPNYFTPNGDGYNDIWDLTGSNLDVVQISIFDRFGKLMFSTPDNTTGWNGKYNGEIMPATDYWFVAKRKNGEEIKGHFSLKR